MQPITLSEVEFAVESITQTVLSHEAEFGELDSVVGDGDFGFSLARGFEAVQDGWDDYSRDDIGSFLQGVALTLSGRIGGTSGPIWGTAFLRAALSVRGKTAVAAPDVVVMLLAAIDGIKARGRAEAGDKTLLDALIPMTSAIQQAGSEGRPALPALAARAARAGAEATRDLQARRGRASYAGERSIGVVDAGAVAVAVIAEQIARDFDQRANATAVAGSREDR